jgi:hypothetical protein
MKSHLAPVPPLDFRGIHHMVEMPVRQQKPINPLPREMSIRPLRRVEQQIPRRCLEKKRIGVQWTSGETVEFIHGITLQIFLAQQI